MSGQTIWLTVLAILVGLVGLGWLKRSGASNANAGMMKSDSRRLIEGATS